MRCCALGVKTFFPTKCCLAVFFFISQHTLLLQPVYQTSFVCLQVAVIQTSVGPGFTTVRLVQEALRPQLTLDWSHQSLDSVVTDTTWAPTRASLLHDIFSLSPLFLASCILHLHVVCSHSRHRCDQTDYAQCLQQLSGIYSIFFCTP